MTRTFQINTLFPGLTVLESVVLAFCEREASGSVWHRTSRAARGRSTRRAALDSLQLRLDGTPRWHRATLPYGKQRLLEIALALATQPAILLLDEPAAGIPAAESAELFGVIAACRAT